MQLRAVLFDIDGTLLDSNDAHAFAWLDALRGQGINVPYELVRSKIGKGGDKLLMEVAGIDDESSEGKAITKHRSAIFKAHYLPDVGPVVGARTLVLRLREQGFARAVVTSSTRDEVTDLLVAAGVAKNLFDVIVTSDDADRSKPDPDLVEAALKKLRIDAREAVLIGDTPYDVAAAKRAGAHAIAFRSGGWKDKDLRGALAIYDNGADLVANLERSPLAFEKRHAANG